MASLGPRNSLFEELVAAYPSLWNSRDPQYRDKRVKESCMEQLLKQFNCLSGNPITLEGLKKKLKLYCNRRSVYRSKQENAGNPQGTPEQVEQHSSVPQLSTITITHIKGVVSMQTSENETPTSTTNLVQGIGNRINKLEELLAEYPCLWDRQDLNYTDTVLKAQCQEQLLVKYNMLSSITITMEHLKKRLKLFRARLNKRRSRGYSGNTLIPLNRTTSAPTPIQTPIPAITRTKRLEELVAEYPCLWNPQDPKFRNNAWKAQCREQLLVEYNRLSSITVNMEQLKKKLEVLRGRLRKRRQRAVNQGPTDEDSRDSLSDLGSSDSTDPLDQTQSVQDLNQTALFNIVFHCCGVCGEVKSECSNVTDKDYVENNKTTLAVNDLAIELDLDKLVCQNCDTKLKEMYDFVKLVKSAQDKMRNANIVDETDEMTMDCDEDEDQKVAIVSDTELVKPVHQQLHERKFEDSEKKCSVTINLNSSDNDGSMDDIEEYQMFKKDITESEEADDTTVVNEDIIDVKTEMDDDEQKSNETGEILTANNIETKYQIFTNNGDSEEFVTDKGCDTVNDTSDHLETETANIVSEVVSKLLERSQMALTDVIDASATAAFSNNVNFKAVSDSRERGPQMVSPEDQRWLLSQHYAEVRPFRDKLLSLI